MNKVSKMISVLIMFLVIGSVVNAQSSKLSVVVSDPETFVQVEGNETTIYFTIIVLDGKIDGKWIKSQAEENSNVIKLGVSNSADFETGERKAYLKVKDQPIKTFAEVLMSLECSEVNYGGKPYSLIEFVTELNKK